MTGLVLSEIRWEQRAFWRNRATVLATFLFPMMFLLIFGFVFNDQTVDSRGGIPYLAFFVPGAIAFGVIAATYINLANGIVVLREVGFLKRVRGTPLPSGAYLAARIGSSIATTFVLAALSVAIGILFLDVGLASGAVLGFVVALVVGTFCFCALGLAVTILVPNAESASGLINVTLFPIMFISSIFFPLDSGPEWLRTVARLFPIQHFGNALQYAFNPTTTGSGIRGADLLVMAAWGLGAVVLAAKYFRWEPRPV